MIPPESKKEPTRIIPIQQEKKKTKVDANLIATILCGLFAIFITLATNYFYTSIDEYLMLSDAKFKKFNQQIRILCEIGFIFSSFILVLKLIIFVLTALFNKQANSPIVLGVQAVKNNSFVNFIIFFGLYSNIVTRGGMGLSKSQLILLANLFFIARILYLVGSMLQSVTGINLKETGVVLNAIVQVMLVAQIFGLDLLEKISVSK